jgi:hypothetical protein
MSKQQRSVSNVQADPDVYRSAWHLIRNHGDKAMREATRRQQAMIKKGDPIGVSLWWSIGKAIQDLRRTKREPHEPLN